MKAAQIIAGVLFIAALAWGRIALFKWLDVLFPSAKQREEEQRRLTRSFNRAKTKDQ